MAIIELASNALIDKNYYINLKGETVADYPVNSIEEAQLHSSINFVSTMFESFCKRTLLARDFTYVEGEDEYKQSYCVFNGNNKKNLWLPTYPINEVYVLYVDGSLILKATDYSDSSGFFVFSDLGKIYYEVGFPCGKQNIQISWNGGYVDDSIELNELKFLCFDMVKTIHTSVTNNNEYYRREQIGTYSYERFIPSELDKYKGMNPIVFNSLQKYRKAIIA